MYTIRKTFKFEASHRLATSYTTCCQQLHGHSYKVEVFLSADKLNSDGMVVDFGKVKKSLGSYIDMWDHALILKSDDPLISSVADQKIVLFDCNPTAEAMANELHNKLTAMFPDMDKIKVRIHETDTGWAEYED